jgi:hypothetical protein
VKPGTEKQIRDWVERWRAVNEVTRREARETTPGQRYRILADLFESSRTFPDPLREAAESATRLRWARLRAALEQL